MFRSVNLSDRFLGSRKECGSSMKPCTFEPNLLWCEVLRLPQLSILDVARMTSISNYSGSVHTVHNACARTVFMTVSITATRGLQSADLNFEAMCLFGVCTQCKRQTSNDALADELDDIVVINSFAPVV